MFNNLATQKKLLAFNPSCPINYVERNHSFIVDVRHIHRFIFKEVQPFMRHMSYEDIDRTINRVMVKALQGLRMWVLTRHAIMDPTKDQDEPNFLENELIVLHPELRSWVIGQVENMLLVLFVNNVPRFDNSVLTTNFYMGVLDDTSVIITAHYRELQDAPTQPAAPY